MPVYVDAASIPYGRMLMCHMLADTTEELLAMADAIGVARIHIQYPDSPKEHFDICQTKRAMAVKLGAVEINWRQAAMKWREKEARLF